MRLKKIEIYGFKSFRDKTTLSFDLPVTVIVGPNGCGKSNVADALRWVLGEQSAKSLRGDKMHDVIFAGTSQSKALNFAEVTIVFSDLQQGDLPIDYKEVAICRRLYRSGESNYFINRKPHRLKDIHNLLLNSGLGKNSYSIFEQGKMDEIILASPLERRSIFEEASGILRFKQNKKEALRKLEYMDNNLSRLEDIRSDVKKQIEVLEKQAEKAKKFKRNKEELELLEKSIYHVKWSLAGRQAKDIEKKLKEIELKEEEKKKQLTDSKSKRGQLHVDMKLCEKDVGDKREQLFQKRAFLEFREVEEKGRKQRLEEIENKKKQLQQELKNLNDGNKQAEKDHASKCKQREKLAQSLEKETLSLVQLQDFFNQEEEKLDVLRKEEKKAQQTLTESLEKLAKLQTSLQEDSTKLESNLQREKQNKLQKESLKDKLRKLHQTEKEREEKTYLLSQDIDREKARLQALEREIKKDTQEQEEKKADLGLLLKSTTELQARKKVLFKLHQDMEGFSSASKKLLKASKDPSHPLQGKLFLLSDFLEAHEGYEKALASSMQHYCYTLLVKGFQDLKMVLEYAEKEGIQGFSLLCYDAEKKHIKASEDELISHLKLPSELAYFLEGISITQTENATKIVQNKQKQVAQVSLKGCFLDHRGVYHSLVQNEGNVFIRQAEIKKVTQSIEKQNTCIQELEALLQGLEKNIQAKQKRRVDLDQSLRQNEMHLLEENFVLQRTREDIQETKQQLDLLHNEICTTEGQNLDLQKNISQIKASEKAFQADIEQLRRQLQSHEKTIEIAIQTLSNQKKKLFMQQQSVNSLKEDLEQVKRFLDVFAAEQQAGKKHFERINLEIESGLELKKKLQEESKLFLEDQKQLRLEIKQMQTEFASLEKDLKEGRKKDVLFQKEADSFYQHLRGIDKEKIRLNMNHKQLLEQSQHVSKELESRYDLKIENLDSKDFVLKKDLPEAEKQLLSLRRILDTSGDVNMTSIEEFDKLSVRYGFLNKQIEDLNGSKKELLKMIAKLDSQSRVLFKSAMMAIRENFQKNFKILFHGGEADLSFTEAEDILEAGVEIVAKPPGKKMRSINLLSGGEKCLTAMSLLFGIFEFKPSPFCVLDEMDAPLDDTNVDRFVNLLKSFIDRTQFLIITHNKRTMSIGDMIFGVSMEEKGVSKLLSMEFHRDESLAEVRL